MKKVTLQNYLNLNFKIKVTAFVQMFVEMPFTGVLGIY